MTYRLTDLLSLTATPKDGHFPVREIFYDPETWRIRYVALGAEGWFDRREMLIEIGYFGTPAHGHWPIEMSREDVEHAPQWSEAPSAATYLPPIVIGPFGYTFSPMMMAAQWYEDQAQQAERERAAGNVEDSTGRTYRMAQASTWIGREVSGPAGVAGRIADMVLDRDWVITEMVMEDGARIPVDRLRHVSEQGQAVID